MSEFEDKLNSILSSPKDMEKIMALARSISGEDGENSRTPETDNGLDPKMLSMLTKLLGSYRSAEGDGKLEILRVMTPYLRRERQESLKRAVEVAKMAKIARLALTEFNGGNGDV